MAQYLRSNQNYAEATFTTVDFLSNGFKLRSNNSAYNGSSGVYLFLAFAEAPFKNSRAR